MSIKKSIKTIIKKCDLFSQQVTFRYNDEPAYETNTGGCISIILIITFIGIFSTTLFKTVNKQFINFKQTKEDEQSPSYFVTTLDKNFMFAIGLDNIDLNQGERYFDIYMEFRHYYDNIKDKIIVPLIPCQKGPWQQRGYGEAYDKLKLNRWLCSLQETQIELQGKFSSKNFKFYKIAAKKCDPTLNFARPCVNQTTINSYLTQNEAFNLNFYFINTIINPGNQMYLRTYLQDVNYFSFSTTNGVNANLFISSFTIETDESLLPNQEIHIDEGGIVLESSQVRNYEVRGTDYMKLFLRKSPVSLSIQRSFRKIDETLSYIGGLFSAILVCFSIIKFYNQLSYEIQITKQNFYYDKNDPFEKDHFNFLTFIGYLIFSFFEKFGIIFPWSQFQRLHRFLEQGRKQIDVRLILQKIIYSEKLGLIILNKNKHKALLFSQPFTLEQADKIRRDMNLFKDVRKNIFCKDEQKQKNQQSVTNNNLLSEEIEFQININLSKKNSLQNQIQPSPENQNIVQLPLQESDLKKQGIKKQQSQILKKEKELNQLDIEILNCLLQLQSSINKNDKLAKKIMDKVDPQIKRKYLRTEENMKQVPKKDKKEDLKKDNKEDLKKDKKEDPKEDHKQIQKQNPKQNLKQNPKEQKKDNQKDNLPPLKINVIKKGQSKQINNV